MNLKLKWFLDHGASITTATSRQGLNALSLAAGYCPLPVLRTLLEHAGGIDSETLTNSNALHEAAGNNREDRTAALAMMVDEFGADVNALSTHGRRLPRFNRPNARPLHYAVRGKSREHVRFLLERGARVTEKDVEGLDVMAYAIDVGCEQAWDMIEEWYEEKELELPEGLGKVPGVEQVGPYPVDFVCKSQ